jgi:hypothetical protein
MDMTGVVNAGEITTQPGATETETPGVAQGTESVASENEQQPSGSQESTEGSQVEGQPFRQRGPSKLDTIRELRAKLRERDQRYGSEMETLKSQLSEMKEMIAQSRNGNPKPSKTFWEAPEEVLDERFDSKLTAMEKRLLDRFDKRETQNQESSEWKQETSEAAKFIQGQKGITPEDQEDIADIVRTHPAMQKMRPMERADYALFLWQKQRGISDKSSLKARAATVVGAPSAGGEKVWTEAEIESKINEFNRTPMDKWSQDQIQKFDAFEREIREAQRAGRVK